MGVVGFDAEPWICQNGLLQIIHQPILAEGRLELHCIIRAQFYFLYHVLSAYEETQHHLHGAAQAVNRATGESEAAQYSPAPTVD